MSLTASSQGKPFGAVQESGIAFLQPGQMQNVVGAYRSDMGLYRAQLPLVVGQLSSATLQAAQTLHPYEENFPVLMDCSRVATQTLGNLRATTQYLEQDFSERLGQERAAHDIRQLAALTARLVCGIVAFDAEHFGQSQTSRLRFEHGAISHTEGLHRHHKAVVWHRDYDYEGAPDTEQWRAYMMRTHHPAHLAIQKPVGDMIVRPLAGEIVLYAVGEQGTMHCSHRPAPADGRQPSFFMFVMQQPS